MLTELDLLFPIARADEALAELRERIHRTEAKVAEAAGAATAQEQRGAAIEVEFGGLRREERKHQEALRKGENLRKAAIDALANGYGDVASAERQRDRCTEIVDESETAILDVLGRRDALQAEADAVTQALMEARANHAKVVGETAPLLQSWRNEAISREAARNRAIEALPSDLATMYHDLRKGRGQAFARLVGDSCAACSRVAPVQKRLDLRTGRVVTCDGCTRWFVDGAKMETAASEEAAGSRRP